MIEEKNEDIIADVKEEDVKLTQADEEKVLKAIKQAHLDAKKLSPESQKIYEEMLAKAKLPIRIEDKDFQMGEQELDVRHLSRANWRQMEFRELILMNIYLRQIPQSLTDILRLLMVIADKLGVEDIIKATDDVLDKVEETEKAKLNKQDKAN